MGRLYSSEEYDIIRDFLYEEADMLDSGNFTSWQENLSEDFEYKLYLRTSTLSEKYDLQAVLLMDDDMESMAIRLKRLGTKHAWAELPPSNSVRIISNIRIIEREGNMFVVRYNEILYKNRNGIEREQMYCKINDHITINGERITLSRRTATLEEGIMTAKNVSVIP